MCTKILSLFTRDWNRFLEPVPRTLKNRRFFRVLGTSFGKNPKFEKGFQNRFLGILNYEKGSGPCYLPFSSVSRDLTFSWSSFIFSMSLSLITAWAGIPPLNIFCSLLISWSRVFTCNKNS
jgi:hypothetical protein